MQLAPSRYRWVVFGILATAVATRVPVGISLGVFPALATLSLLSLAVTLTGVALGRLPKAQQLAAGE